MIALSLFLITVSLSVMAFQNKAVMEKLLLYPYRLNRDGDYYTVVTSGFIHADWQHLMFNGFTFYFFAFVLEEIAGSFLFFWIYIGSLILASLPSILKHRQDSSYRTLGASGAISGAMIAFILYAPESRISLFLIPVPIPAPIFALLYLVGSYYASKANRDNINHDAHLFGAFAGGVIAIGGDAIFMNGELVPQFIKGIATLF